MYLLGKNNVQKKKKPLEIYLKAKGEERVTFLSVTEKGEPLKDSLL